MARLPKGSPSSPETITIGYHYNYPISLGSSPRSSPLPDYKDASSQVPAKHDHGPPEHSPDISEEKLWCSSSTYDSDRASGTGKLTKEVQGGSATTLPATTAPGNEANPRIPSLVIAIRERSKALSRILVKEQATDEREEYCAHIKEATDCYISTVEDILEHARRAEKSQWKDLEE
ncbi:unnamed protein product [Clonostachys rhizophaga]|uniref:Uncharacterized protein n=1 Tax=Clonostachys rhizophaga TaxID=160324 RepID=A0A9N9UZF9_9HYPO|nr:unnamed protein product [Clonostachys rhizophaga]